MKKLYEWILITESKQEIVNLGYPEIIAKLFYEKYGRLAYLLAKWYREYLYPNSERSANWWLLATSSMTRRPSLYDLTYLYSAASSGVDAYKEAIKKLELSKEVDEIDEYYLKEEKGVLEKQIKNILFSDYFFTTDQFIKDVTSGIIDSNIYKRLSLSQAQDKYDKKNVFTDREPIKTYTNGYKWINVGKKCQLIGKLMKNCGSSGLMSMDSDATMIVLFDASNKPHVVLTYSPNQKTLIGDEGVGGSEVKSKYHEYLLDIASVLNAELDVVKSKSILLKVKYLLRNITNDIKQIPDSDNYNHYFKFDINGKYYYTDSYVVVSEDDLQRANSIINSNKVALKFSNKDIIKTIFNYANRVSFMAEKIKYVPIFDFVKQF